MVLSGDLGAVQEISGYFVYIDSPVPKEPDRYTNVTKC